MLDIIRVERMKIEDWLCPNFMSWRIVSMLQIVCVLKFYFNISILNARS